MCLSWPYYDWAPCIFYINPNSIGKFPNRIAYYHDDTWADLNPRYTEIMDQNWTAGAGNQTYAITESPELAPYLNTTVGMYAVGNNTPISSAAIVGPSIRLTITSNSHGFLIRAPYDITGTTVLWSGGVNSFPRGPLTNDTLRSLYRDKFNTFINNGFTPFAGYYYPNYTPFTFDFQHVFSPPYLISGLDNLLSVSQGVSNWLGQINQTSTYFAQNVSVWSNTTLTIPVNFNLSYPSFTPSIGQGCDFNLSMAEMGNPNVTIQYNYTYMVACDMQLVHGNYNITNNQTLTFTIPLHQINMLLQCFNYQDGISGILSTLSQKVINYALDAAGVGDYVEVDNFQLGNNVVGNIVSCDIHVHLWPIIKWIVENECPEILPLTDLIDEYILDNSSGLDLIISPQLQGIVEGLVNCNNFQFNNNGYFVFNSTQSSMLIHGICLSYANPMQVTLQNMNYTQNFMLNWAFEVNFKEDYASIYNGILSLFGVNSTHWNLGTYPNVNISRMAVPNSNVISLGMGYSSNY